jgi:hypothetical protein
VSVSLSLDKRRELKFDIRACRELEAQLGKPLGAVLQDITSFGVNAMVVALWAGLKHEDKALTIGLTEKLFSKYVTDKKSMRVLIKKLSDALDETGLFQKEEDVVDEDDEGNVAAAN